MRFTRVFGPGCRKSLAALTALALSHATAHAYTERTLPHPVGVVDHDLYDDAADVRSYWMRVPVQWKFVERSDGVFSWGAYDAWLAEMDARRINMTPVLVIGKVWANWQSGDPWAQDDPPEVIPDLDGSAAGASRVPNDLLASFDPTFGYSETYYDFVYQWVSRYGESVDRITIENEVNAANFWESPIDGYRRILVTARKAALDANPDVLVFESGMGSGSWAAAIAEDRFDAGKWTWQEARDFMRGYYERDIFVQNTIGGVLASMNSQQDLEDFFAIGAVIENNTRVTTVLDNLFSSELGAMLVDGLNLKFTGDDWYVDPLVSWIDERIGEALPRSARGVLPLPKVNNEASSWCIDGVADWDQATNECILEPGDGALFAREMIRKVVRSIHAGVSQSVWFPLSNENTPPTPRIGLFDYDGVRLEAADAFAQISRFIGYNRDYTSTSQIGSVQRYLFTERFTARPDVYALWWDDGSHGTGQAMVTLDVPAATIRATRYTMTGDSLMLVIEPREGGRGSTVNVLARDEPVFVYFDDGVTPAYDVEPLPAPVPAAVVLAAPAPNPSSGAVRIRFGVPRETARAVVDVYDAAGRRVVRLYEGRLTQGVYRVRWDGRNDAGVTVGAGTFVVRLATGDGERHARKVVLIP